MEPSPDYFSLTERKNIHGAGWEVGLNPRFDN
jgi:hypothetical protein